MAAQLPALLVKAAKDGGLGDCPFAHYACMCLHLAGARYELRPTRRDEKPAWHLAAPHNGSMPCLCPAWPDGAGATTIETGALVNRNLSQREFVATYGNRLDAQGKAIKDLQESQLPKASIEQELEALRGENARMLSDGQAAIDAISAENAALRSELETVRANPPIAPAAAATEASTPSPPSATSTRGGSWRSRARCTAAIVARADASAHGECRCVSRRYGARASVAAST